MCRVRTISRKGSQWSIKAASREDGGLIGIRRSENPQRLYAGPLLVAEEGMR
jgi:hypothetical protein